MAYRIGVDVGGTFTDLVALAEDGSKLSLLKVPSTPDDPSRGLFEGLDSLLALRAIAPSEVSYLGHGTTVCLNAILERKGVKTGLVTTRGMRDLLELRRQTRDHLYDLQADKPEPLIPRPLRLEVPERTLFDGSILEPLDLEAAARALDELAEQGIRALAICFLHSYANPAHEAEVKALAAKKHPELSLSVSSEVLPEFREFERLSTTVVNAYVGPLMTHYLARVEAVVERLRLPARPHILQSNGGVVALTHARERPVFTIASGPSAGVAGAAFVAREAGFDRIISFDMGGTSTDICLVERGTPLTASEKRYHGHPVKGSMLDLHSIGAGGGSIAWVDAGGFLRVGPQSAGAAPGPACYGQGGPGPTVTDANLVLGRLNPDGFLGGKIRLDPHLAEAAIGEGLCRYLSMDIHRAAAALLTVVNANMASAIRLCSVARGYDPRAFTLVAYGGAGPMHASAVARQLGIPRVLVPANPGVLSALGLVLADVKTECSRTRIRKTETADPEELEAIYRELETEARQWARRGGFREEAVRLSRSADMRYVRQNYELGVPVPARIGPAQVEQVIRNFHRVHRRVYGYASPDAPTELVSARVMARIPVAKPALSVRPGGHGTVPDSVKGERRVFFDEQGFVPCLIYERAKLPPEVPILGPAILEQLDCTAVMCPDEVASIDLYGNLLIELPARPV
ncbi:MAG: hydantoinase/oxoprolinase family protein [Candidatus Methylomirabilia bacterium]